MSKPLPPYDANADMAMCYEFMVAVKRKELVATGKAAPVNPQEDQMYWQHGVGP
jgi:hypothetical protein